MHQDPSAERLLPAHGAFVMQFGSETEVTRGQFVGRVLADVHGQPCADVARRGEALETGRDRCHPCARRAGE